MEDASALTPATSQNKISIDQLSKLFGTFVALCNLTVELACGRIYVILGENGAGKSTLLRVLAGITSANAGEVRWPSPLSGKKSTDLHQARIGYMAHASMLYDELSARENLEYFAGLYAQYANAETLPPWAGPENSLRAVGLDPALARPVGQYSQGMRQRVSLARAVQHDPALVLLDEPFSNVDAESARRMIALIVAMRDAQRTVILTTHQPALVEDVADEFLTMASGTIASRRAGGAMRKPGASV